MNVHKSNGLLDAVEIAALGVALSVGAVGTGVVIWSAVDLALRHRGTVPEPVPPLMVHDGNAPRPATSRASSVGQRAAA